MDAGPPTWGHRIAQGLNASVGGNAQAFGFSIVPVSFGVVSVLQPPPGLFLFAMAGAAIGICHVVSGTLAWLLVPLLAGMLYVLVQSVELAVDRQRTPDDAEGSPR